MSTHVPLGRGGDLPGDPMSNLMDSTDALPRVPMDEMPLSMRSPDTLAQKRDSFFKPGDPEINANKAAGPKGMMTMPGGNAGDGAFSGGMSETTSGSTMQQSKESDKTYSGPDVQGKVIHSAKSGLGKLYK